MEVYISFAILILIAVLFAYIIMLARTLNKQQKENAAETAMQSTARIQSRAETIVFAMIGILILDYAMTFPEKSSPTVFFFYGRTGIIIGAVIIAISLITYFFPVRTSKPPVTPSQ